MAGGYKRRQMLLRREDGAPNGFVRFELAGLRCTVEVVAKDVPTNARAVLLRADGGAPQPLGELKRQEGIFALRAEQADGYTQAAVLAGDTLLLVGGEGAVFSEIRDRLIRRKYARKQVSAEPKRAQPRRYAEDGLERNAVKASLVPEAGEHAAGQRESPSPSPAETTESPAEESRAVQSIPRHTDASKFAGAGWTFTQHRIPGAPERISGRLVEDGRVKAVLHGVAGVYAPEPPPGLSGYIWDAGYWVRVKKNA